MTVDRRAWDPFAPHPRPARPVPEPVPEQPAVPRLAGLDAMRKPDLVALAEQHGLDATGTRPELIARLREAGT